MSRVWKCPNTEAKADHPQSVVLFRDAVSPIDKVKGHSILVPRAEYCSYCKRSYTRTECVEVVE